MPSDLIDPATGKPIENPDDSSDRQKQFAVSEDDWNSLNAKLRQFEETQQNFRQAPQAPPKPVGPSFAEQQAKIETEIDQLSDAIDEAISEGKPIKALRQKQRSLETKLTRMTIEHESITPLRTQGLSTLSYLTKEVTRKNMPHYELVQKDMENFLSQLSPEQQADPQIQQFAYEKCVGSQNNLTKILAAEKEKILREAAQPAPDATGKTARQTGKTDTPNPRKILSAQALRALREKGQTPDEFYRSRGYEGWSDYWDKKGKRHFQDRVAD